MSLSRLNSAIADLPYSLREQIIGFATYVDDASDDLLDSVGISDPSRVQVDQLVYVAGLWRLWQIINSQFSLLDNSLALLQPRASVGVSRAPQNIGYLMGGNLYSRNSPQYAMLIALRDDLRAVLRAQQLGFISSARNLPELVRNVASQDGF